MAAFTTTVLLLFAAIVVNDFLLARRIRNVVELGRIALPQLDGFKFGGSPIGVAQNLLRLRNLPAPNELSDPDLAAVRTQYRVQVALVLLFAASILVALLSRGAA